MCGGGGIYISKLYLFIYLVCTRARVHELGASYGRQRTSYRVSFLLFTIRVLVIELRLSGLVASTLPTEHLGSSGLVFVLVVCLYECGGGTGWGWNQRFCIC